MNMTNPKGLNERLGRSEGLRQEYDRAQRVAIGDRNDWLPRLISMKSDKSSALCCSI